MKKAKRIFVAAVALLLCAAMISLGACGKKGNEPDATEAPVTDADGNPVPDASPVSLLTGWKVETGRVGSRPIAVVVENHPSARPQWGFTSPAMVIEYEVEGGISRMLWLYDDARDIPEAVGPVRSARHDSVELAYGMDAYFIHIGGSPMAYQMFTDNAGRIQNLDGRVDETFHYKDETRDVSSEHRSVAVGSKIVARLDQLGARLTTEKTRLFSFGERDLQGVPASSVSFRFSSGYAYRYSYEEGSKTYVGEIDGKKITDEKGELCRYDNLIILSAETVDLGDEAGHIDIELEKGGSGYYIRGGVAEQITWAKPDKSENLQLFAADGSELVLNPGRSYIGIVRSTEFGALSIL